jgi:hypothetical protein
MGHAKLVLPVVALVAVILVVTGTVASQAQGVSQRCNEGDAQAMLQAEPVAAEMLRRGQDHPGLLDTLAACQYRVYLDGRTFTFCEDDVILGGLVWFWPYVTAGISREDAIADIELIQDRVWIDGEEQTLERTAFKDLHTLLFGQIVYQQRAFITQLPPGDHESFYLSTDPRFPDFTATVHLHVLPHELCG